MADGAPLGAFEASIAVRMTPFDELGTLMLGLAVPTAGFLACAYAARSLIRRQGELPKAAEGLAALLDLPIAPLDGAELAGLVGGGVLQPDARASSAVRWDAPDAVFSALVVAHREGPEGIVVVTPKEGGDAKPRLADFARRTKRDLLSLSLPGDLRTTAPDVTATRIGGRLVVRRPNVRTAEELERLLMCACAILDG